MALAALMQGRESELEAASGDISLIRGAEYILALDADTRLLPGAAEELIGAMLHPLNRAVVENGRVVRGRGLIHPRMDTELQSAVATRFARVFAPEGGTDPYNAACGEVWMDLAGAAAFPARASSTPPPCSAAARPCRRACSATTRWRARCCAAGI